jgi:23S rRNA pseudouridine1911/1915/1917 synthase
MTRNGAEMDLNGDLIQTPPVPAENAGIRLDKWLASCTELSRSRLSSLITDGRVLLDGHPAETPDRKVRVGESYSVEVPPPVPAFPQAEDIPLDIVYEDADLLVLNKPAGMVVHPAVGNYEGTLVNALLAHCGAGLSGIGGVARPGIVHRLDKDTSGLLVVAKNDAAHHALSEQFAVHSLERRYKAFVWGIPEPAAGVIETQIGRSRADRKKMAVLKSGGKHALTQYRVLEVLHGGISLVECSLKTGRTHQVRVHMTHIGHPLLGDAAYGRAPAKTRGRLPDELFRLAASFPRQALHSCRMSFVHPRTGETMTFELPLPPDMQTLNDALKA